MSGKTILEFTEITTVAPGDKLVGVDVSDTTASSGGTNKSFTKANLLKEYTTLVGEETLTNKALTTPVIPSFYQDTAKTKLMTTPNTASDTLATLAATQTLTNKTLTSPKLNEDVTVTIKASELNGLLTGWIPAGETWAYASATTFTISGDKTDKYQIGDRLKLTQTTVKYFRITDISYSSPNTTITISGMVLYTFVNATVTDPFYSKMENPQGFPQKEKLLFNGTASASITLSETSANFDRLLIQIILNSRNFTTTLFVGGSGVVPTVIQGLMDEGYRVRTAGPVLSASGTTLSISGSGTNYSTDTTAGSTAVVFRDTSTVPTIKKVIGIRW